MKQTKWKKIDRLTETTLYILKKKPGLSWDGLMWILFRIDMEWYGNHGKPFFEGIAWIKTKNSVRPAEANQG